MRELRFVAPGEDGNVILETTDAAEQFTLVVNDALRESLRPDPSDDSGDRLPVQNPTGKDDMIDLRPRDIQTRVRAGEDPQHLAEEAGTTLEKVMRFAYPVLQERVRVIDEARRARTRSGADGHPVIFGDLFDHRIAALGTEPDSVRWDSFRRPDGGWTVTSTMTVQAWDDTEVPLLAKFSLALLNRTVSALNDVAADLIHGTPIRALQKPPPALDALPVDESGSGSGTEAGAGTGAELAPSATDQADQADQAMGQTTLVAVTNPDPERGPVHEHRSPLRLPSRRQKAHTHPVPVAMDDDLIDDLFDQEAFEPSGPSGWHEPPLPLDIAAPRATAAKSPSPTAPTVPAADPAPSIRPDEAAVEEPAAPEAPRRSGRSNDKPRMPSWDDILLGVRRKD